MLINGLRESTVPFMGKNGLSRLRWLGVMAPEARNPAEAGRHFLTILLASCGSAAPVASGARRPERFRWRCGAPKGHGGGSPPRFFLAGPVCRTSRGLFFGGAARGRRGGRPGAPGGGGGGPAQG